jgi:hypothetical protein
LLLLFRLLVVLFTGFGEKMGKNFEIIFKEFHNSETFVMSRALLEDYKAKAAQEERERIIKLLQGIAIETKNGEIAVMELLSAIEALIKGENK